MTDKGLVEGYWKSRETGEIMKDINRQLEIGCNINQLEEIKGVLLEIKNQLEQEALYIEYDGEIDFL